MTILYLIKSGNALHPADDASIGEFARLPFSKPLRCEVKQPRNPAFHRLYFALCKRIADGVGKDAEDISTVFKFATGHVDRIRSKSYGDIMVPKSISFAKLDNTSFRAFFEKCVLVATTEWGIEATAFSDLLDPKTEIRGRDQGPMSSGPEIPAWPK